MDYINLAIEFQPILGYISLKYHLLDTVYIRHIIYNIY